MKLLIVLGLLPLFNASPFLPSGYTGSDNIGLDLGQVRNMADILMADLINLNADPNSAAIIRKIFAKNNKQCLRDMDDALLAIQEGTQLLEASAGEIQSLVAKVENMIGLKDEAQIVREVASVLRSLKPLLTKLAPKNPNSKVCRSSSESTFEYLRSLSVILEEFSEDRRLAVSPEVARMLVYSGSVVSGVTSVLQDLATSTREVQNACNGDKLSGMRAVSALGDFMLSLADMVSTLGGLANGKVIRDGKKVADRIVAQMAIMKDFQGFYTCSPGEDMNTAASALDDLASLIQEIGVDTLQQELGVDVYSIFDLNNQY